VTPTHQCIRCTWRPAEPGEPICWTCAISISRSSCPHRDTPELVIYRTANGYRHPKLRCRTCYKILGSPKLRDIDETAVTSEVRDSSERPSCCRCGRTDAVEAHHWAPHHLFADADDWPTAPLCPACHRLWHVVTGTAGTAQPDAL
jgi:hypothetical protein